MLSRRFRFLLWRRGREYQRRFWGELAGELPEEVAEEVVEEVVEELAEGLSLVVVVGVDVARSLACHRIDTPYALYSPKSVKSQVCLSYAIALDSPSPG